MPLLDVSFVLDDPTLADTFDLQRRIESVGTNGRVSIVLGDLLVGCLGVVTQQSPGDVMRQEAGMSVPKRIFVASRTQFIALAPGLQPDEITWNGAVYAVESVFPYSRYGSGFYECVAQVRSVAPPLQ